MMQKALLSLLLFGCVLKLQAQDPFFSLSQNPGLYYNPAEGLSAFVNDGEPKGEATIQYRDQWNRVASSAFSTAMLNLDYRVYESYLDSWNLGAVVFNDRALDGALKYNSAGIVTSYSRVFNSSRKNKDILSIGGGFSFGRTNVSSSQLWFGRQYDTDELAINENISSGETTLADSYSLSSFDLGLRFISVRNRLTSRISFAMAHINQPSIGFSESAYNLPSRYFGQVEVGFKTSRYIKQFGQITMVKQGDNLQLTPTYGLSFSFEDHEEISMDASLGLRLIDNVTGIGAESTIIAIGVTATKWKFDLSYDINVSSLNFFTRGGGALELRMGYFFGQ